MLSRKTRSQIIELIETVRGGLVCQNTKERAAMLDECIAALSVSYEIIQKELSHERLAQYDDTIATVKAAMMQLKENPDSEEIAALSLQLIDWLLGQLRNEHVKKEIVFLPYKASMWDSLESIWKAAYEDKEHCNTYVIPIPYADLVRDEQGQLTVHSWHCEIDEMPDYVPVIDNETVSLEEMHPDVIFIHNPYDNTNYVTSVDMRYYSSELKKYTDKLIYVPYFVVGKNLPKHLAEAPGILNADYVIVESEEVKEEYERYYPGGNPPDGKFIALGSPKFDKVLSTKREDYILPEKWHKLLKGRKAVLYNTSVSAVLLHRETYLKKIRSVLDYFRPRNDVVLWWRPHPLFEATVNSILPEHTDEYRRLRFEYIQAGWGIYDDSPELERAITCTDAYYGDASSVVWLYEKLGKQILIQAVNMNLTSKRFGRCFSYLAYDGLCVWFLAESSKGSLCLYEMKLNSNYVISHGFMGKEHNKIVEPDAYNVLAKVNNKVLIAPFCSQNNFVEYNCLTHTFAEVPNPKRYWNSLGIPAFSNVVCHKDSAFFFGNGNDIIVEYDGRKDQFIYHENWLGGLKKHISSMDKFVFDRYGCACVDSRVYFVSENLSAIICLDLDSMEVNMFHMPLDARFSYITYYQGVFYLLSAYEKKVVRWDEGTGAFHELTIPKSMGVFPYCGFFHVKSGLAIIPMEGNPILKKMGNEFFCWKEAEKNILETHDEGKGRFVFSVFLDDDKKGFALHEDGILFEYNQEEDRWITHKPIVDESNEGAQSIRYNESCIISLGDFLDKIKMKKPLPDGVKDSPECGKVIMKEILNLIA